MKRGAVLLVVDDARNEYNIRLAFAAERSAIRDGLIQESLDQPGQAHDNQYGTKQHRNTENKSGLPHAEQF